MQTTQQTQTIARALNTRLTITTATPAPAPKSVSAPTYTLTEAQAELLAEYLAARDSFNEAQRIKDDIAKRLALPRFEGEARTVVLLAPVARKVGKRTVVTVEQVGEIQVSFRSGFTVPPCWVNKVAAK